MAKFSSTIHMPTRMALAAALSLIVVSLLLAASPATAQNRPDDFVRLHNEVRAQVGVGPLVWDEEVAAYARNYAPKRTDCQLIHSGGPFGENIYEGYGEGYNDAAAAVKWWAAEGKFYDYETNTCSAPAEYGTCLHYTQIVWAKSTKLGCARIHCNKGGNSGGSDLIVGGQGSLNIGGNGIDVGAGGGVDVAQSFITCNYSPPGNYIGQKLY